MAITLQLRQTSTIPIEVEGILPESLRELSLDAIRRLPIYWGRQPTQLGELCDVSGDPSDETLVVTGPTHAVHWLGAHQRSGTIRVEGDVGRHAGSQMRGGRLEIEGTAGDWLGAEMRGGTIAVQRDAGSQVGGAYRGSPRGMRGGTLTVHGNVGSEAGARMRRGTLAIGGHAGTLLGYQMLAGTILVTGKVARRYGVGMRRGTLALLGQVAELPGNTFRYGCRTRPLFLTLLLRELAAVPFPAAANLLPRHAGEIPLVELFHGDFLEGGRGEVLLAAE